jgi:hypothetical protein
MRSLVYVRARNSINSTEIGRPGPLPLAIVERVRQKPRKSSGWHAALKGAGRVLRGEKDGALRALANQNKQFIRIIRVLKEGHADTMLRRVTHVISSGGRRFSRGLIGDPFSAGAKFWLVSLEYGPQNWASTGEFPFYSLSSTSITVMLMIMAMRLPQTFKIAL